MDYFQIYQKNMQLIFFYKLEGKSIMYIVYGMILEKFKITHNTEKFLWHLITLKILEGKKWQIGEKI